MSGVFDRLLGAGRRQGRTVQQVLAEGGVPPEDIETAQDRGTLELLAVERLLIPDEKKYSLEQTSTDLGFDREQLQHFWRALGFPDPKPEEKVFTDTDVANFRLVKHLLDSGIVDPGQALQMTRVIGSSLSRIATAQVDAIEDKVLKGDSHDHEQHEFAHRAGVIFDLLPQVMDYVWRRHLQADARKRLSREPASERTGVAVGFADLVGFTALSQQVPDDELARLVDRFEAIAYDTVSSHNGRVVKMIGDEVMFTTTDTREAVEIGLALAETFKEDEALSDVRVGVACGPVLEREGDLYGPVVNLASREVGIAYPGSVVVSPEVHESLAEDATLKFKSLRSHTLKDIGKVRLWTVRRAGADTDTLEAARRRRESAREWIEEHVVESPDRSMGA
jgi:adenylate cyclase